MDDELIAAVETQDDGLEQPSVGVESQPKLACGTVVVQILDPEGQPAAWTASSALIPCLRAVSWTFTPQTPREPRG
jgi:hypothetical protein